MSQRSFRPMPAALLIILALVAVNALTDQLRPARADASARPVLQEEAPPENQPGETTTNQATYSAEAVLLVAGVLVLLALLFFLLLYYLGRLDRTSYLGRLYHDTTQDIEYKRLVGPLQEKLLKTHEYERDILRDHEWLSKNPPPSGIDLMREESRLEMIGLGWADEASSAWYYEDEDPEAKAAREREQTAINEWRHRLQLEARRRYREDETKARAQAQQRARQSVSVDFGLLHGRGPEFALEFTAVVVIIFTAAALGFLKILNSEQIGTLLAAIAGYVLGRATTRSAAKEGEAKTTEQETRTAVSTLELAELLRVVAGTRGEVDRPPTVTISEPAPAGQVYKTNQASVRVAGKAADDNAVEQVQWTNRLTGASGIAELSAGTTSRNWSAALMLQTGSNVIEVVARDTSGNASEPATLTLQYEPQE